MNPPVHKYYVTVALGTPKPDCCGVKMNHKGGVVGSDGFETLYKCEKCGTFVHYIGSFTSD
jgi:hypothetical protein